MDTAIAPSVFDLLIPALALLVTGVTGWLTGKTARAKGYSFGLFFGLSFVSWFVMATIVVFIKPRAGFEAPPATQVARSRILYVSGVATYIAGITAFVLAWGNESDAAVTALMLLGPALTIASIFLLVSAVNSAKPQGPAPLTDFEIS
jgi:hypothetical protein